MYCEQSINAIINQYDKLKQHNKSSKYKFGDTKFLQSINAITNQYDKATQ